MNLHFSLPYSSDTMASICLGEYDKISTCRELLRKRAKPPALLMLGTTSPCCLSIFRLTPFISETSYLVYIRKTKVGSFSNTTFWRALTVRGFPSPLQFQLMALIVLGGAALQPLPIPSAMPRVCQAPLPHPPF